MTRPLKSTLEWQALARHDALYAIACWEGKKGAWTPEEFYGLGRSDWEDFRRHWRHFDGDLGGTCVELGCGAGRLTVALADDFDRVVGVDVSPEMLELARAVVPANVELALTDATEIPLAADEADAVFTTHVLQHLDGLEQVTAYLRDARRVLRPGGTLLAHIPISSAAPSLRWKLGTELAVWRSRRKLARGEETYHARVRTYRPEALRESLVGCGFDEVELRVFAVRSNGDPHAVWLAR